MNWIKKINVRSTVIVVAVVIVPILIYRFLSKANHDYSITDAFSALADLSMAIAAFLGLLVAKKWQREATLNKSIDISIAILTESIPRINGLFVPTVYAKTIETYMVSLKNNQPTNFDLIIGFRNLIRPYGNIIEQESDSLKKLRTELKSLYSMSWIVNDKHKVNFDKYVKLISKCVQMEIELNIYILSVLSAWNINFDDDSRAYRNLTWNLSENHNVFECIRLSKEILRIKEDFYEHLKVMNVDSMSIFDVFEHQN